MSDYLLWLWNDDANAWIKAKCDSRGYQLVNEEHEYLAPDRHTETGLVNAGETALYWLTLNPSGQNAVMALADAVEGGGTVVYDQFHAGREAEHFNFRPAMKFTNGLYLETFTNLTSVIFGWEAE